MDFNVNYHHHDLRRVETVFSLRKLNKYWAAGHVTLLEKIRLKEELFTKGYIFRDRETGEYIEAESRIYGTRLEGVVELPEEDFEEICSVKRYARRRSLTADWAAYILPLGVQEGEELYIKNLIEDVLVSEFWGEKIYAVDGIAVWDGARLNFKRELFDENECLIVG